MSLIGRDSLSKALAASAHPVRRDLLKLVQKRPRRVTELAKRFDISLAAVSRHVRVLEDALLVSREVRGRIHLISARHGGLVCVEKWVAQQSHFWSIRLENLKQLAEGADG